MSKRVTPVEKLHVLMHIDAPVIENKEKNKLQLLGHWFKISEEINILTVCMKFARKDEI